MEQQFQDVAQKVAKNKNDAHFAKHFTQKPSTQQCGESMSFDILSIIHPIDSMKT